MSEPPSPDPAPPPDPAVQADPPGAKLRSALKRVGSKAKSDPAAAQKRRGQRSAQAALGMMDKPPFAQDEEALKEWLAGLQQPQKEKLARLIGQTRQAAGTQRPERGGLARIERHLAEQGINFDINANTVIVNIGANGRESSSRGPWRGKTTSSRGDWGRQWGRVKDFINGH